MTTYRIKNRDTQDVFEVNGQSYEDAAALAIRTILHSTTGKWQPVTARRSTGDPGKSGVFTGYQRIGHEGGLTSIGPEVHVSIA